MLTATAGEPAGSGAEDGPGGAAAGGSATANGTSAATNEVGAGGRHGVVSGVRERVAIPRRHQASEYSQVGGRGGGGARPTECLTIPPK